MAPSSGATVIILTGMSDDRGEGVMLEAPYMASRSATEEAVRRTAGLCTPFLVGLRKGPSTWAPRDSAPSWAVREAPDGPR